MGWLLRAVAVVCVVVIAFGASPAHAGRIPVGAVINSGYDILHIRALAPDQVIEGYLDPGTAAPGAVLTVDSLGYMYERFGVFWFDVWRWDGKFVAYSGSVYAELSDEELAQLGGASVPWNYRIPPGLLLILAGIEFWLVTRRRLRAKRVLIIGAALIASSIALYIMGVDKAFAIPLFLGLYHVVVAWFGMRAPADDEAAHATEAAHEEPREPPAEEIDPPPLAARRPGEAQPSEPLAVIRPATAPVESPIVHDASAEPPKLLR